MKNNRIKYLVDALKKGKYYKPNNGFINMDEITKKKYSNELLKFADGGGLDNLSNEEQSYKDYIEQLKTFNTEQTQSLDNNFNDFKESQVNQIGSSLKSNTQKGISIGSSIGSIIPGVGTGIGAGIGAGIGLLTGFVSGKNKNRRQKELLQDKKSELENNKKTLLENNRKMQSDAYSKLQEVYPTEGLGNVSFFGANGGGIDGDPPARTMTQAELDNLRIKKINERFGNINNSLRDFYSGKEIDPMGLGKTGYKGTLKSQGRYSVNPSFAKTDAEALTKVNRATAYDRSAFRNINDPALIDKFLSQKDLPINSYEKFTDSNNRELAVPQYGFDINDPKKYFKDVQEGTRQVPKYKDYGTSKRTLKSGKTVWRGGKNPKVIGTQDEKYYYYTDKSGKEFQVNENRYNEEVRKRDLYNQQLQKYNTRKQNYLNNYSKYLSAEQLKELNDIQVKALGGKLKDKDLNVVQGGESKEIANNVEKIEGNTHEQGGVKLANQDGKQVAEVEGEEIIKDGNDVYSERMGYADEAEKISRKKAKYEKKLNSSNKFERATAERMVERLDKQLDNLFEQQEIQKGIEGKESQSTERNEGEGLRMGGRMYMKKGGKLEDELEGGELKKVRDLIERLENKVGENDDDKNEKEFAGGGGLNTALNVAGQVGQLAIPLIDNLYNRKQIQKIPEIPLPEFQKAREFDTTYNINPQLEQVDNSIKAYNTGVARTSIQPQVTRANSLMANLKGLREKNLLRGQKENIETNLFNQSQANKQSIDSQNIAKRGQYRMNKYLRENEILGKQSANVANAVQDLQYGIRDINQRALDNRRITLDAAKYSDTGVSGQLLNDKQYVTSLRLNKSNQNQMKETIMSSGRKDYIEQWNKLFPNNKISNKVETKNIKPENGQKFAIPENYQNDYQNTLVT